MCGPFCECTRCVLGAMAADDAFRERVELLLEDFKNTHAFLALQERNRQALNRDDNCLGCQSD